MSFLELVDRYGIAIAVTLAFVAALIPILKNDVIPALVKQMVERENFRRQIEIQRLQSANETNQHINALATSMMQTNERIAIILQNQTDIQSREEDILRVLNDGITAMRERTAASDAYRRGRAEHQKGDTDELNAREKK